MNIQNIKTNKKGFFYYQTTDFVTIKVKFYFLLNNTRENYIKANILSNYMVRTNKKYATMKKIRNKSKELYGLNFSIYPYEIGARSFLVFELEMVDPRVIGEDYFDQAISFFKDMMLNPNFNNDSLNTNVFNDVKNELINIQRNAIKNPNIMHGRLLYRYSIPNSLINNILVTDIEEYETIIMSITENDIIKSYKEIMDNFVFAYSFGNLTDMENNKIMNIFNFKAIDFDYKYNFKDSISTGEKQIESKDTSQSYLYVVYDISNYNYKNNYLYKTIQYMLNSMNGLCLEILRGKLGIVYSAYSVFESRNGLMYIYAEIDEKNKEIALKGIDEIFKILHDENELERLLNYSKEKQNQLYNTNIELLDYNINEVEKYVCKKSISSDEEMKLINKIMVTDIIKQVNYFEKKFIFFYKGEKNEK